MLRLRRRGLGKPWRERGANGEAEGRAGLGSRWMRAVGVLVVKDGRVSWRPLVDVSRTVLIGQQIGLSMTVLVALWRGASGTAKHRHHALTPSSRAHDGALGALRSPARWRSQAMNE